MKNFTLYWPQLHNSHLTKDVGAIPFILKKYYSYNSCILVDNEGAIYEDNHKYLENLTIKYINGNNDRLFSILKDTDILMVIGIYDFNIKMINVYKELNPLGKIYIKTDLNINWLNKINLVDSTISTLKSCNLISVECKTLCNKINETWPVKAEYIPNGYYNFSNIKDSKVYYNEKENTILTVGRIGTYQKATEILLNAFKLCEKQIPNWKLQLVGNIENKFKSFINDMFAKNPHLANRIHFTGAINDRYELCKLYKKAKIFCLTSNFEGFPLVFPEAAHKGCYIISTDIDPAYDITCNEKYGKIFPIDDSKALSQILINACNNEPLLETVCSEIQDYCNESFDWIKICGKIDNLLN